MKKTSWAGVVRAAVAGVFDAFSAALSAAFSAAIVAAAIVAAVFAPAAFAAAGGVGSVGGGSGGHSGGYRELWNPPEARMYAPRKISAARKPVRAAALSASAGRRHGAAHAPTHVSRFAARRVPSSTARLMAKQNTLPKSAFAPESRESLAPLAPHEPDMSDIPRQITPEGNVLRVRAQAASAVEVVR